MPDKESDRTMRNRSEEPTKPMEETKSEQELDESAARTNDDRYDTADKKQKPAPGKYASKKDKLVDEESWESFPASDPPSHNATSGTPSRDRDS